MATADIWSDFESFRHSIKHHTVDKLKQILTGFNDECYTHLAKSGKKQEIIDRIVNTLDTWRTNRQEDKWSKAKSVLNQVRQTGIYAPNRAISSTAMHVSAPMHQSSSYSSVSLARPSSYSASAGSSSALPRYDPYAPPRRPSGPTVALPTPTTSKPNPSIRFKPSPFYSIDHAVTNVVECPESTSATDRRQQTLTFTLNTEQLAKLKLPNYQLRLFCTSSMFYTPAHSMATFRQHAGPCPIEYPPTCEVRVNNMQVTANLKGLKKKPGTAPPPDIGKYVRLNNLQNRVEMVYVNNQQPVQPKKFYLIVMLVEVTTVEQLVDRLKKGKYKSSSEVKQKMAAAPSEDDDIVVGPQKMSLKCPLSFMRVDTPCRSIQCVHPQCFDATSWFSVMEQTTTYLCPVCEKGLTYEDLIIDGYFDEILKQCPDSIEDVIVEADGEWHTSDNKYGSEAWKASHPPIPPAAQPPSPTKAHAKIQPTSLTSLVSRSDKAKANDVEVVVLDSDDEDEGQVKRELSASFASNSSLSATQSLEYPPSVPPSQADDVIDLTLDSDQEEPPRVEVTKKRKAADAGFTSSSPTEEIWKKGRSDRELPRPVLHPGSSNTVNVNGNMYGYVSPELPAIRPAAPSYSSASMGYNQQPFSGNSLPPIYPYVSRTSTQYPTSSVNQSRPVNGSSRWP